MSSSKGQHTMDAILERYLEKIKKEYRAVDARGVMQVSRIIELPLDEIFVGLTVQLTEKRASLPSGIHLAGPAIPSLEDEGERFKASWLEERRRVKESGLSLDDLWQRNSAWVLLGDPGSGKTTVIKHLALTAAKAYGAEPAGYLPIPVTLRYLAQAWADNPAWRPRDAILRYLAGPGAKEWGFESEESSVLKALFEQVLQDQKALLLFDGLDEQRDTAMKQRTADAIEELLKRYAGNRCMVTSRIIGYDAAPLGGSFVTATLEPFNDEQMDQFFHNWMYAVERREDIVEDAATRTRAEQKAQELIEQIQVHPGVKALAANPLLCTIIGLIHRQGGTLPSQRVELYKLCIDTFIFNWEMHKRRKSIVQDSLDKDETQAVLEAIALYFQEKCQENRASRDQILEIVQHFLVQEQGLPEIEAQRKAARLLDMIREVAGLLIDRGNDEYGFFHLTFQEYLTARAITRRRSDIDRYLAQYLFDPRWREVIRLAAAHQGTKDEETGSEFIKAIRRHHHQREQEMHYAFRMAFLCATEARVELNTADELFQNWVRLFREKPYLQELLMNLLKQPGTKVRYRPGSLQPLLELLKDEDAGVRWSAAYVLGNLKDSATLPALLVALQDKHILVRRGAAEALGNLKDSTALPALLVALQDKAVEVRRSAVQALSNLKAPAVLSALLAALQDEEAKVRRSAAEALGNLKDSAVLPALLAALQDKDAEIRWRAAQVLGNLKDSAVLPALLAALQDKDAEVRWVAAQVLGNLKDPAALSALLAALQDEDVEVRWRAAQALGELKDPAALPALLAALQDEEAKVRRSAAYVLGNFEDSAVLPALLAALQDDDAWVRFSAAEALGNLKDPAALPALLAALQDKDAEVRSGAAEALGNFEGSAVLPALLAALQDEYTLVRWSATQALGELKDPAVLPALLAALQDNDAWVCSSAANAIELIDLGSNL
jgi:HEAT repeat protein